MFPIQINFKIFRVSTQIVVIVQCIFDNSKFSIYTDNIDKYLSLFSKDQAMPLIFHGGVLVDVVDATMGKNRNTMDPLDEKKRKDVKRVLHDQFCDLDIKGQGNTCSIQNLKYRVMGISCEVFQICGL